MLTITNGKINIIAMHNMIGRKTFNILSVACGVGVEIANVDVGETTGAVVL